MRSFGLEGSENSLGLCVGDRFGWFTLSFVCFWDVLLADEILVVIKGLDAVRF